MFFNLFVHFDPLTADPARISYVQPRSKQNMTVLSMLF